MSEVTDTFSGVNNIKVTSSKARHLHECEVRSTALSPPSVSVSTSVQLSRSCIS